MRAPQTLEQRLQRQHLAGLDGGACALVVALISGRGDGQADQCRESGRKKGVQHDPDVGTAAGGGQARGRHTPRLSAPEAELRMNAPFSPGSWRQSKNHRNDSQESS